MVCCLLGALLGEAPEKGTRPSCLRTTLGDALLQLVSDGD
jgi:hypothetical protein